MENPYTKQPDRAFWRSGVADRPPLELSDIYRPKFAITKDMRIACAGSCFAQHIGRQFRRRGYNYLDLERPPLGLGRSNFERFGFNLYSARYGNIYTVRQLMQLFRRAFGRFKPRETVWQSKDRYFDPFRPTVEPNGFSSEQELRKDQAYHLKRVRSLLAKTDLFVFTFGLTEAWLSRKDGAVFPSCPGTHAGTYDEAYHRFHNFTFGETLADAKAFIKFALKQNRQMKFLVTVSPVPLTATAGGLHVLEATIHSKSVLRAVCGELRDTIPQLDYFPSYEMVASHPMRGMFYESNLRVVSQDGVGHVMNAFFESHGDRSVPEDRNVSRRDKNGQPTRCSEEQDQDDEDAVCDEEILEAFGR